MTTSIPTAEASGPTVQSTDLAIETEALSKIYSQGTVFKKKYQALDNVSLQVSRGEVFGLLGPNGAGKTTFLKILLGIIRKTSGDGKLLGFPLGSREGRKKVGYLPEHLRVPSHLTGYQALELFGNLSNVPTSEVRAKRDELLELVGLSQRAKDGVKQYSKGMLQRLGLAQALLHDPELLVLDEPTDGLDPRARAEMRDIMRQLQKRGVTVFLNSHLLHEVEMVCERVAILDKGVLRFCGSVQQAEQALGGSKPEPGIRVQLELEHSDAESLNQCFQALIVEVTKISENRFKVDTRLDDQPAIDDLIDRLRSAGVGLISLNRTRISLEDAFLQMVDESSFKN
jgi:ABC-2 type transport system ATP-binding protein